MKPKFFLLYLLLALSVLAQDTPQTVAAPGQSALTNDAIIKMVQAGLGEGVIISMVNTQPANYTLTPEQLIALKSAGVSDRVVTAMVTKYSSTGIGALLGRKVSGATPPAGTLATGDPNDPTAPHDSGIYLYAKNRKGEYTLSILEQAAYQGSKTGGFMTSALTYGIKKVKMKAVIPGQHASIRAPESESVFYFYFEDKAAGLGKGAFGAGAVSNPNQFALIKLDVTKSSRETTIGDFGILGMSTGTNQKSMVSFKSERLKPGLYRVVPDSPMKPGEYCFLVSQVNMGAFGAGAAGANQIFDFAVERLSDTPPTKTSVAAPPAAVAIVPIERPTTKPVVAAAHVSDPAPASTFTLPAPVK
jgi:hypothetical protein